MKLRFALPAALVALVAALSLTAATASAAAPQQTLAVPVTAAQTGGALDGVVTLTNFVLNSAGQVVANGTFTGTYTDAANNVTQLTDAALSGVVKAAPAAGGCRILDLVLGPLHLDVLGLVVDLNQVHLNITAQPGPGNLLGNLLCSVANLLNNNGSGGGLQGLVNLLNQILGGL